MKKTGLLLQDFTTDNILSLMDTYLKEWCHRDELLWKQIYTYFYATLLVLFLPNLTAFIGINLPKFPSIVFPSVALIMSIVFLYVSIGYTKRLAAIGDTYQQIIGFLPSDLRRISITDARIKYGKIFNKRMSVVLCFLMFVSLLFLSVVMIIYYAGLIALSS